MNAVNRRRAIKFLEANLILDEFIAYLNEYKRGEDALTTFLKMVSPFNLIDAPFVWDSTKEGYKYWRRLDEEWNKLIESKGRATWREKILSIFY
jgi:hypothetical protein